jgi:hypothetical protein
MSLSKFKMKLKKITEGIDEYGTPNEKYYAVRYREPGICIVNSLQEAGST